MSEFRQSRIKMYQRPRAVRVKVAWAALRGHAVVYAARIDGLPAPRDGRPLLIANCHIEV